MKKVFEILGLVQITSVILLPSFLAYAIISLLINFTLGLSLNDHSYSLYAVYFGGSIGLFVHFHLNDDYRTEYYGKVKNNYLRNSVLFYLRYGIFYIYKEIIAALCFMALIMVSSSLANSLLKIGLHKTIILFFTFFIYSENQKQLAISESKK